MTTLSYLVFLLLLCLLAWPLRSVRARQALFLVASYVFYAAWSVPFLGILLISSLANYALGQHLRRHPTALRLWAGVAFNLALLALFKYLPPISLGLGGDGLVDSVLQRLVLPLGVSFYTFQAISYLVDIYHEREADPSLLEFCLYMAFWPTVLAGPICRLPAMLPQFRTAAAPTWDDVSIGTRRIVIGLFMKVVLAQFLANGVLYREGLNRGFDEIEYGWGGLDVWMLAIAYGFQLFFDFAGYSHIVIGSARLFGIRLAENFDQPYLSTSPSVFWTRWHMSLSFWIRDYVFFPLATARRAGWWRYFALIVSMTLFGLWHGASLLYVIWGLYHGVLLVAHRLWQQLQRRLDWHFTSVPWLLVGWAVTFALVSLGWIFFRANSLDQALTMLSSVFTPQSYRYFAMRIYFYVTTAFVVGGYFAYVVAQLLLTRLERYNWAQRTAWVLSPVQYAVAIFATIVWSTDESAFVYFQF